MARRSRKSAKLARDPRSDAETPEPDADDALSAIGDNSEGVDTDKENAKEEDRDAQLCGVDEIHDALVELYDDIEGGFNNQADRSDDIMDYWDLYNCKMGGRQAYAGNSKIFVPIITNAVNARKTRFTNQIFPQSGRNVECTTSEDKPNELIALLEHYIRRAKLRTQVMPALMKNGDIEGQYNICVSWGSTKRTVTQRVTKPLQPAGQEPIPGTDDDDIEEETVERACPIVEVLGDSDVLVLPETANSIEDAIYEQGGSVTVIRRWSKSKIKKMIADEEIEEEAGEKLLGMFTDNDGPMREDKPKKMIDAAGIQTQNGTKYALIYETYTLLTYNDERRLYKAFFGAPQLIVGCKRNPYWSDRCPILSVPVEKVQGSFKGISKLKPCADMQYAANDAVNEGMDSAAYSMLPIIMTDPLKNPRIGTMVLNLAAIWETNPNDTQFAQFPELWKSAFEVVGACEQKINQTLSVSPAVMPQSTSTAQRRNQAELAQEAQVDILSTADAVTVVEEGVLTPLLQWFVELDHQFRDKPMTVREYGEMGVILNMQEIKPVQMNKRFEFRWFGVESARNAQQVQQQIATMNVLRGIPPEQYEGYKLNMRPIMAQMVDNAFGSRMAPEIFQNMRSQLSNEPQLENTMLLDGFDLPVHPLDEDAQHLQAHAQIMQNGDPTGMIRVHMAKHIAQLSQKTQQQAMMQQQQQMQQGMPGVPGGAGPGGPQPAPGVAGSPRIGAQPQMPTGGQGPPGMIHHDQLNGAGIAPRR
jgi:hypothetical protein